MSQTQDLEPPPKQKRRHHLPSSCARAGRERDGSGGEEAREDRRGEPWDGLGGCGVPTRQHPPRRPPQLHDVLRLLAHAGASAQPRRRAERQREEHHRVRPLHRPGGVPEAPRQGGQRQGLRPPRRISGLGGDLRPRGRRRERRPNKENSQQGEPSPPSPFLSLSFVC